MRKVAADIRLLLGLRLAVDDDRPLPYSTRFCAERCGLHDQAHASRAATPAPMNADTRVLSTKAIEDEDRVPTQAELERELIRLGIITERAHADQYRRADPVMTAHGPNGNAETKAFDEIRRQSRDHMLNLLIAADAETKAIERKAAPIKVAEFEC